MTEQELIKHLYETGQSAFEYALQLSQRDEWQPIDNCPEDQRVMLSHWENGEIRHEEVWIDEYIRTSPHPTLGRVAYVRDNGNPTHWKPISPPIKQGVNS